MAAAELELNIGMSTISRHVKGLETRLGLVLCRRGRAGFALTPEGELVYDETLRLLAAVEGFRVSLDDIHQCMGWRLVAGLFGKNIHLYCAPGHPLFDAPQARLDWDELRRRRDFAGLSYTTRPTSSWRMRAVQQRRLRYECEFVSALRRSPRPPRAAPAFHRALLQAH